MDTNIFAKSSPIVGFEIREAEEMRRFREAEKWRFQKARKISVAEYKKEFPGYPLFSPYGYRIDGGKIDDYADRIKRGIKNGMHTGECPAYLYGANRLYAELCPSEIIEDIEIKARFDETGGTLDEEAKDEIWQFCEKWNEKNRFQYFVENWGVVVLLQDTREVFMNSEECYSE